MLPRKTPETIQMNLMFCDSKPMMLPDDKKRELAIALADLLHADANGVTNIPQEIAAEVADAAEEFVAAEAIILNYVKAPGPKVVAKFNELRQEFQAVAAKLQQRLSRKK